MVRSYTDEVAHQYNLRKKYLEDPNYRKLSDIATDIGEINPYGVNPFAECHDHVIFCNLITNQSRDIPTVSNIVTHLNKGHELPINWVNLYAYFDERLNDPRNRYLSYLKEPLIIGDVLEPGTSIEELLNRYRDRLLSKYDMI